MRFTISDEDGTKLLAGRLAEQLGKCETWGIVLFLYGDLGAGKTTFSRHLIQSLGHSGNVKSPTYTLVEPYQLSDKKIYHFDLYRLSDPEELEFMGIRDYFSEDCLSLVEWPEKGLGMLPQWDVKIEINHENNNRTFDIASGSKTGEVLVTALK
ncbi:MAG: tRNA (adenosine(37)-N6)-threonylcarbamoyltransferase complex ATPase subunit type 1 TsaE [Pseudomonadota bacterium]